MTTSSAEVKKTRWGFVALSVLIGGYNLFTGFLLGSIGHFPNTQGEFMLLGIFLYGLTCCSWLLALGLNRRPGFLTFLVGFAGMVVLSYSMFFFA